jgi:hypothetical protein
MIRDTCSDESAVPGGTQQEKKQKPGNEATNTQDSRPGLLPAAPDGADGDNSHGRRNNSRISGVRAPRTRVLGYCLPPLTGLTATNSHGGRTRVLGYALSAPTGANGDNSHSERSEAWLQTTQPWHPTPGHNGRQQVPPRLALGAHWTAHRDAVADCSLNGCGAKSGCVSTGRRR